MDAEQKPDLNHPGSTTLAEGTECITSTTDPLGVASDVGEDFDLSEVSPEVELPEEPLQQKPRPSKTHRPEERFSKRQWVEVSGGNDNSNEEQNERPAVRAVFQGIGKIESPVEVQVGRLGNTKNLYAVAALMECGKTIVIMESQVAFSAKRIHETLMLKGIDCPSSNPQTYAAISRKTVSEIQKSVPSYFFPGTNPESGETVYSNGLITGGKFYPASDCGLVEISENDKRFIFAGPPGSEMHCIPSTFLKPESRFTGKLSADFFRDLISMFGPDIVPALVLIFMSRFTSPKKLKTAGFPFNVPFIFCKGEWGAGKSTAAKYLSEVVCGIADGDNGGGSTPATVRNRLCYNRLHVYIEEAHHKETPVSLFEPTIADMTRKSYSGGDFSHSSKSFKPLGSFIFDGVSTGGLNDDIKQRLFEVDVPKVAQSQESKRLREAVNSKKERLRIAFQNKLLKFSENPQAWWASFEVNLKIACDEIVTEFSIAGRASWPALLIAGSKMLGDDFDVEALCKTKVVELLTAERDLKFKLTSEFLLKLCTVRDGCKVKFICGEDELKHFHVASKERNIVRISLAACVEYLRSKDSSAHSFVTEHIQRELGIPIGKDASGRSYGNRDPLHSIHSWVSRNRDKKSGILAGGRFLEFRLADPTLPFELSEVLTRLAAPSWPEILVEADHGTHFGQKQRLEIAK